jgi:hypothetical protein
MATRLGTAVRIHLKPRSRHQLSDTRSILDALKKFGEVNTFKNLKVLRPGRAPAQTQEARLSFIYSSTSITRNQMRSIAAFA